LKKILLNKNVLSLVNNFIGVFFGMVNIFLLTRGFQNQELFGIWIIYVTSIAVIEMLKNGLMRPPLIRFLSGCKKAVERNELIGSNWVIGITVSFVIALILLTIRVFFSNLITGKGFVIFFTWYPFLTLVKQPLNNAISVFLSKLEYNKAIAFQLINQMAFTIFLLVYFYNGTYQMSYVVLAHFLSFLLGSILVMVLNYDGLTSIGFANFRTEKRLLKFGFYTMGVQLSGSLYKNSDQLLLGILSAMGPVSVALYTIPLKLAGVIETFTRSFSSVSFQKMSVAKHHSDNKTIKRNFYKHAGTLSVFLIPVLIFIYIFAENIVVFFGGKLYVETAGILRIFLFYLVFIPINQYLGIVLVALDLPKLNFIRVFVSLLISISLNTIIILSWDNLYYMAYTKIFVILVSVFMGLNLVRNEMKVSFFQIYKTGFSTVWRYLVNFINKMN